MTIGETDSVVAGSVVHHQSDRVVVSSEIDCMIKDLLIVTSKIPMYYFQFCILIISLYIQAYSQYAKLKIWEWPETYKAKQGHNNLMVHVSFNSLTTYSILFLPGAQVTPASS